MSVSEARRAAVSLTDLVLLGVFAIGLLLVAIDDLVSDNTEVVKWDCRKMPQPGRGGLGCGGRGERMLIYYT